MLRFRKERDARSGEGSAASNPESARASSVVMKQSMDAVMGGADKASAEPAL